MSSVTTTVDTLLLTIPNQLGGDTAILQTGDRHDSGLVASRPLVTC
jgi:hypothetical protein